MTDWKNSRMENEIRSHEKEMMEKGRIRSIENKVNTVRNEINEMLSGKMPNRETRELAKALLTEKIDFECTIKCDEENNPSDIVDQECIVAQIMYDNKNDGSHKYMYVVFGDDRRSSRILMDLQV